MDVNFFYQHRKKQLLKIVCYGRRNLWHGFMNTENIQINNYGYTCISTSPFNQGSFYSRALNVLFNVISRYYRSIGELKVSWWWCIFCWRNPVKKRLYKCGSKQSWRNGRAFISKLTTQRNIRKSLVFYEDKFHTWLNGRQSKCRTHFVLL